MDTEPINTHNEYLLRRYINIMKIHKFEKETYNGIHIIPGTVLDELFFFNLIIIQIITIHGLYR